MEQREYAYQPPSHYTRQVDGVEHFITPIVEIRQAGADIVFVQAHLHCETGVVQWVPLPVKQTEQPKPKGPTLFLPNGFNGGGGRKPS